jgi:hypothetical protein
VNGTLLPGSRTGLPIDPVADLRQRLAAGTAHVVGRFLAYEYLLRTAEDLALTDIRAQHPGATTP